jgi:hypothetical protein
VHEFSEYMRRLHQLLPSLRARFLRSLPLASPPLVPFSCTVMASSFCCPGACIGQIPPGTKGCVFDFDTGAGEPVPERGVGCRGGALNRCCRGWVAEGRWAWLEGCCSRALPGTILYTWCNTRGRSQGGRRIVECAGWTHAGCGAWVDARSGGASRAVCCMVRPPDRVTPDEEQTLRACGPWC